VRRVPEEERQLMQTVRGEHEERTFDVIVLDRQP
jgi:hypothetical protein